MENEKNKINDLTIHKYGDKVLRVKCKNIEQIDDSIIKLIDNMKKKMIEENGVGLAAPQVGIPIQLAIVDPSVGENPEDFFVLINPEIISGEGEIIEEEGCLSLPGILLNIKRNEEINLKSIGLDGKEITKEYSGFVARIIQHEMDHLNGVLIIDRVSSLKKQFVKKEIKKLKKNGKW